MQKINQNLTNKIFQPINRNDKTLEKSYINVKSILNKIFETMGRDQVLSLLKLRKIWSNEIDSFLSKNSYPRNISVLSQIKLSKDFFNELDKTNFQKDFYKSLEKMNEMRFNSSEQFNSYLLKKLKRSYSKDEMEWLKNKIKLVSKQNILHLTVYDGSISNAIRLETEAYLRIFNRLFPEIKLDDIRCHVGELEQVKLDQSYISYLAKEWHLIIPKKIHQKCVPAFIYRDSRKKSVLVLYVATREDIEFIKFNHGLNSLRQNLQKIQTELQVDINSIKFVIKSKKDLEEIRLRSIFLGVIPEDDPFCFSKTEANSKSYISKTDDYTRKNFSKIREIIQKFINS